MRRNLASCPSLRLEHRVGAPEVPGSNVYPHTPVTSCAGTLAEILYRRSIRRVALESCDNPNGTDGSGSDRSGHPAKRDAWLVYPRLEGPEVLWPSNTCPFVSRGSTCVRWDGHVSLAFPSCTATRATWRTACGQQRVRPSGRIRDRGSARFLGVAGVCRPPQTPRGVRFSRPCTPCNSCELADGNQEDCFGNSAPTCGGCLWAQGFILCP